MTLPAGTKLGPYKTVTAIIDRLERAGVRRRLDKGDRRRVFVELRQSRMKDLVPLCRALQTSIERLVSTYRESEISISADFPEKSDAVLQREAENCPDEHHYTGMAYVVQKRAYWK